MSRSTAAAAASPDCVIRLKRLADDQPEVPRLGQEHRLPLDMDSFKTVFSIRASFDAHSGALEMESVRLALLRLTRSSRLHGHRGVLLVDAQVGGFALRKGRSSATTIWRGCCAVAALELAADLKLVFPYLPSESNPADYPSRGVVRKRHVKRKKDSGRLAVLEELEMRSRRALRRLRAAGHFP